MTFDEKLEENRRAYLSAKKGNKCLNKEVATRNNIRHIVVTEYDVSRPSDNTPNNAINADEE